MQLLTIWSSSTEEDTVAERVLLFTGDAFNWYQQKVAGHAQRTARLAEVVARQLEQSEKEKQLIRLAALFHDIGKIAIPTTILDKPGPLTEKELSIMRRHPEIGFHLLERAGGIWSRVAPLVLAHHERWDGRGYPYGLTGEAIPIGARILAVVDSYDAITRQRSYHQPRSPAEAKAEVRQCAGNLYDPLVVETFLQVLDVRENSYSIFS